MTAARPGRLAIIEQLQADGHQYVFGNPGTVEEGLLDALETASDVSYVFALHEGAAIGIADGYARATHHPTIVQLHSGVGLGNGIGMLYQAYRGHAPLVVLAGDAGVRYEAMDAQMAADLVAMARPVTKWAARVTHPESVLRVLRRAMKVAATPPRGPVFVALPMDVLDCVTSEPVTPTVIPDTRVTPSDAVVARLASALAAADRPMIVAGDGVSAAGAHEALTTIAELIGAPVWGADWAEVNMDHGHCLFGGLLGHMFGAVSSPITSAADVVLICGTSVLPEVFPALSGVFADSATVIHVDLDTWEIGKNFPVDLAVAADPGRTLRAVADRLAATMNAEQRAAAQRRRDSFAAERANQPASKRGTATLAAFLDELRRQRPADLVVFDEAITASPHLMAHLQPSRPGDYYLTRGGSLGVGFPGAIGIQLAHPQRTVVGFAGDGGSMYTFQALWTAAHHRVPTKFVVCNNGSYQILKDNIEAYWQYQGIDGRPYPSSFELRDPHIGFVDLARSLGVEACVADTPEASTTAVDKALGHPGPYLVDLVTS